jgi:DNA polymerase III epsilon subunit-like protein
METNTNNLFIDFETDGKFIVQVGYILTDINYNIIKEYDKIINTGTIISERTRLIHGISTEISRIKGVPLTSILEEIKHDFLTIRNIYTHNAAFDIGVLKHNLTVFQRQDILDLVQSKNIICTMKTYKQFVGAIDKNSRPKFPNLAELYFKVFNTKITEDTQHNALYDSKNLYYIVKELSRKDKVELIF